MKANSLNKILSVVLVLCLAVLIVPAFVSPAAAESNTNAMTAGNTYVLDATKDLDAMAAGEKEDGATANVGTDTLFTLHYSSKTKIDSSSKTFDDGYTATQRINMGGSTEIKDTIKNAIEFTTEGAATVKVWWVSGGDNRALQLFGSEGTALQSAESACVKNSLYISEFELTDAGKYYIGSTAGSNYYFKVEVTVSTGDTVHTHKYKEVVTAPTCTEDGYTTYTCSCGDSYTGEKVAALGHKRVDGVCSACGDTQLLAKANKSGEETYIENTYFEFLGASIRYADADGEPKPTNLVDIRFSYKFKDGVEITKWGWDYKLGTKVTGSKEGEYKTNDNVTNLVFTNIAFINFEYKIQARIWFEVEIDGKTYTVYGNYDSRTTLEVVKAYTTLTDPAYADAKEYAKEVYAEYQSSIDDGSYVHNFTFDEFTSDFYIFAGGQITNGKHGTYTYDFGSGTETLNYALKLDSGGSVEFTPTADGAVTIAVASSSAGRTVVINDGSSDVGTVEIKTANELFVLTIEVSANTTYTIKRSSGESALYYVAYIPD